jgi:diaminopimelate decarboxylase
MHHFHDVEGEYYCEEVPLEKIAQEVGTPAYVYSNQTLVRHFQAFDEAFREVPHLICFSAKSNSNLTILNLFGRMGGGVDIVSGGELYRAVRAGIPAERIVYSGVGKTDQEIDSALRTGILLFNVESSQELDVINERAGVLGTHARIAIRVNPDVDPQTHPYVSTGLRSNKFGIDIERSMEDYLRAQRMANVEVVGVDCHIGSQLSQVEPFVDALKRLKMLIFRLREAGIPIQYLDLGGGLGITYHEEEPPHPTEYARAIIDEARDLDCTLILEPGRVIVGNAGVLLTRVLYTKEGEEKRFVIVDAGMNDLIRPSLYGSFHRIRAAKSWVGEEEHMADLVGPICESSDFLAKGRRMPAFRRGDLVLVMSAGAYGFTMSSNYNSRPRAAEVLVRGDQYAIIRQRETYEDIMAGEEIPQWVSEGAEGRQA